MVEHTCAWCDEESPNAKRCAGCRKVWYCSKTCQTDHWPRHIFNCKSGQPISTAYYLSSSVWGDEIPVDAQTRIDYGFDKAEKLLNGESGSMLLGLYKGLFYAGVKEKELRLWQREGRLIEGIKATFEALPPRTRGGYYPWFLQHQYLLDGSPPDEDDVTRKTKDRALSMLRNGWIATGGSPHDSTEEIEAKLAALSEERRACHHFYTMLFSQAHPSPDLLAWLHFGFVASSSMGEEMHIARLYIALLNRCTFEEFCVAYETSSISALFDRYDIPLGNSPQFRDVMSGTPHVNKSVWDLKQYVDQLIALQPDAEGLPPLTPSVLCDYGFSNCKSPAERKMLDEMYTQLFAKPGMDPLALHEACIKGQLFDFVKSLIKLGGRSTAVKYARLLRNPYPLPDMEGLRCV
ncbi:uncharacterized protein PHACADRAFT_248618 [Phanerochaete carnosa HHB-10118-sp]|uniref:MYND-type domain-containing protein n=1 Tax=Phanerochaete carnosa (strain HHB-10118-sp) TaxID=650164 RepID=K5WR89_PHACS|nr:uncharacterized protein PHACADRAFT_248618 [Phanerochaete carnosa HHB-10118-sp]EKM61774.1 hypothetical protein PHACADRAFT_248618 [Phanerochaete carnosa HHB-10118-sp]